MTRAICESLQTASRGLLPSEEINASTACYKTGVLSTVEEDPRSMVIWNGNGFRRRWMVKPGGFRSAVEWKNPDLILFLESKAIGRISQNYSDSRNGSKK